MVIGPCLSQSTAHGLMNIGNARFLSGKLLWLFLTIAMLVFFVLHSTLLYRQLLEENVLVTTDPNAVYFIQPDIVFCPERFFARDYINHPPDSEYDFMLNVSKEVQRFDFKYRKLEKKQNFIIWDSLNLHRLYKAFFNRKHELFLSIKCNMRDVPLDDIEVEMNLMHFACFRLKVDVCPLSTPFHNLIVKFYLHIYGTNITYSKLNVQIDDAAIDSHLFIQKEEQDDMEDGVHVYLVQPHESINEGTPKTTARVNTHTTIRVKSTKHIRMNTRKNQCSKKLRYMQIYNLLEENFALNHANFTFESLCREMVYQRVLYSKFQCVIKRFPITLNFPHNVSFCGDITNLKQHREYLSYWKKNTRAFRACDKSPQCDSVLHSAIVNYNSWPRTSTMRRLFKKDIFLKMKANSAMNLTNPGFEEAYTDFKSNPTNVNAWKRNVVKVSIYPGEFRSTVVEESPAYSYKNLFSDIGGIMGFYLGASMLTLCEVLRLMHCTILALRKKKDDTQENEVVSLKENAV